MHQHRFRDALQTSGGCWALREPTRKERTGGAGSEGAGERARVRSPAGALPAVPARGWARPGRPRPRRKLLFPFPLLFPRVTGRTVWERPSGTRILKRRMGEGGAAAAAQRKTKSASIRASPTRSCLGEDPARPGRTSLCSPSKTSLAWPPARVARGGNWEASSKVSRSLPLSPAPFPTPSFLGFAAAAGEELIRFASKDCIYSVLLGEARKHPSRPGRRDVKKPRTHSWRVCPPTPHPRSGSAQLQTLPGGQWRRCEGSGRPHPAVRARPWGWSSGQNVFYNCKQ